MKNSAECLKSSAMCLCYNTVHAVPISHSSKFLPRQVGFAIWLVLYLKVYNGREGQLRDRKSGDQSIFSEKRNIAVHDDSMITHINDYEFY